MMAPARTQSYVNLAQPIGLIEEKVPLAYRLLEFWSIAHEVERGAQLVATNHEEKRQ